MANNFKITYRAPAFTFVASGATPGVVPTTLRPAASFDPDADQAVIIEGVMPDAELFLGTGTLKIKLIGCANTTTAADQAQFDVITEFVTPGAGEALNSDDFDATPDSDAITHSTTAYAAVELEITLTPAATPAAGDKFRIKITRDADNVSEDDLAVAFLLTDVEFYEEAA